jgi:AraC-like DNA-binding protein
MGSRWRGPTGRSSDSEKSGLCRPTSIRPAIGHDCFNVFPADTRALDVPNGTTLMSLDLHWLPLAELFDCVEDVLVWVKDREGHYCWVNRAFLINFTMDSRQDSGVADPQDVIGKTDYDLSPAFLADQFRLDDEYVLAGHRIVDRIELVGQPEGQPVWNLTNKIPLVGADGSVVGTAGLTRNLSVTRQGQGPVPGFGPVLAYLRDHYQTTVTNRQLAKQAHMSVRAFERKFLASFHLTPQKYLRKLRMRMASRALVNTRDSMVDVAIRCGFSDQSHFTREFRRHFGRTPREYREYYARAAGAAAPVTNPAAVEQATAPPVHYR